MINKMLEALQKFFMTNFPELESIYMEPVEDGLERPSIFIDYKPKTKVLNKARTEITLKCSIMFFLPEDRAKGKSSLTIANVESTFLEKTKQGVIFYEDKAYRIKEIEFDKRSKEIVILFDLSREFLTEKEPVQKMGHVELDIKFN
jgi:hypothetical protein